MKKVVTLFFLLWASLSLSQNNLIGKTVKASVDIIAEDLGKLSGVQLAASLDKKPFTADGYSIKYNEVIESGLIFKVIDEQGDNLIVKLNRFRKSNDSIIKANANRYDGNYYVISSNNFNNKTIVPKDIISVGLLTIPFKARLRTKNADFSFSPEFNLQSTLAVRLAKSYDYKSALFWQFGTGVATVALDESNSDIESAQNIASLSFLTGFMFDRNGTQIGVYLGWDSISNNSNFGWVHQSKPWISFGIGFGLFDFGNDNNNGK